MSDPEREVIVTSDKSHEAVHSCIVFVISDTEATMLIFIVHAIPYAVLLCPSSWHYV